VAYATVRRSGTSGPAWSAASANFIAGQQAVA
jgi:hypothetical protein